MAKQTFENLGPIYTTAEKYEAMRIAGTLEIGREYRIVGWEAQEKLQAGVNIKTINDNSVLGAGNIAVQQPLVSGTNIKTINNNSILDSGNLDLQVKLTDAQIAAFEKDTTYTGDNTTIEINTDNQISVKADVYQAKLTDVQIAAFEKDTTYAGDNATIEIDADNKISVKADVYQAKLTDEQITAFEKDTTYSGDNSTIEIDTDNKISVKADVYQAKLTNEQIAAFEKDTVYSGDDATIEIDKDNKILVKDGGIVEDKLSQEVKTKLNAACAEYTITKTTQTATKPVENTYYLTKDAAKVGEDIKDTLYYDDTATTRIIGNNQVTVKVTDDAARSQWGGGWRMPTFAELDELWNLSGWEFTEYAATGGVRPGYATITNNGNSIILPTTNDRGGDDSDFFYYVSCELKQDSNNRARSKNAYAQLWKGTDSFSKYDASEQRQNPLNIRPVLDKGADANGHTAVDLGLSVLWADRNIGASDPKLKGDKFAWGETEPKTEFSFDNYKYYDKENSTTESRKFTKYVTIDTYGTVDNLTVLDEGSFYTKKEIVRLYQPAGEYVTLDTAQTISGNKTISGITTFTNGEMNCIRVTKGGSADSANTSLGYDGFVVKQGSSKYIKFDTNNIYDTKFGIKINIGDGIHYMTIPAADGTIALTKDIPAIPECPETDDGTYILKCTVASGVKTYTWVKE